MTKFSLTCDRAGCTTGCVVDAETFDSARVRATDRFDWSFVEDATKTDGVADLCANHRPPKDGEIRVAVADVAAYWGALAVEERTALLANYPNLRGALNALRDLWMRS